MEEFVSTYGMQLLAAITTAILGGIGMAIRNAARRWLDDDTKRTVAKTAVAFAEQIFQNLHGAEKMEKAMETACALLREKGICWEVNELKILLEAAVLEMNRQSRN